MILNRYIYVKPA